MKITCLGTGSKGNCYIIEQEGYKYLLDCGIDFKKIITNVNLNEIDFCYVSHEHKDHSLNLENLLKRRVKVIEGRLIQVFQEIAFKNLKQGKLRLFAFPVWHGSCANSGLIVQTENECLLYATDFSRCKYNLKSINFTHLMVECNYDEAFMSRIQEKTIKHIRQQNTHMGFNGLTTFISKAINLEPVQEIILIHLSNEAELIDRDVIREKAMYLFKKRVGICKRLGGIDYGR